ncbi:MAG: class I SAM-dependent methyltransferase [Ignavibacteriaceae bacterium]|nr:class I SAM-dependent methyltransferase [Ignavibacteriaceae bacterium]
MKKAGFDYIEHYKKDAIEFDYFTPRKGATEHDERRVHEYILSQIKGTDGNSVLDIGCGSAWLAKELLPKNYSVFSTDISLVNVKKARAVNQSGSHFGVVNDSFNLPYKENSFDYIVASEIIEHIPDPAAFVAELIRVLKKEGRLIITTPYKEVLSYSLCIHCNKKTPLHAHIHSFDEIVLSKFFKEFKGGELYWGTFGNKFLIFARTYTFLKYLNFPLWKFVDKCANFVLNKPVHIILNFKK